MSLNMPVSKEEVMKLYEAFPAEFKKQFPMGKNGITGGRGISIAYLQILVGNIGREFRDGSQELINLLSQLGVVSRDPQFRHIRYRPSGNGFPIHAEFSKEDGLQYGHYKLVAFAPDPRWRPAAEDLLTEDEWEDLQKLSNYVCACCHNPASHRGCHKGHMDPSKLLTRDNCAPMCKKCNHETSQTSTVYKWDDTGNWPHVRASHRK